MKGTEASACEATMQACIPKVTRVTLVQPDGKCLEILNVGLTISLQDDCQTLKIFTKKRSPEAKDLGTKKYRQRVVPNKKKKEKKKDHLKETLDG